MVLALDACDRQERAELVCKKCNFEELGCCEGVCEDEAILQENPSKPWAELVNGYIWDKDVCLSCVLCETRVLESHAGRVTGEPLAQVNAGVQGKGS